MAPNEELILASQKQVLGQSPPSDAIRPMSRKLSPSSSSISSCSSNSNGCKTLLLPTLQINNSKSFGSCPSLTTTADESSSNNADGNQALVNKTAATIDNSINATPKGGKSETEEIISMKPKTSKDSSTKSPSPALDNSSNGKENQTANVVQISDAIADIAASCNIQSKRKRLDCIDDDASSKQSGPPPASNHLPIITHPPKVVTASISNQFIPPTLQKRPFDVKNSAIRSDTIEQKIPVHRFNAVGLKCGDDGKVLLEDFDSTSEKKNPLPWTLDQHRAFATAIFEIGLKDCSPTVIIENMRKQQRYVTRERIKSRLQKFRQTKERSTGEFLKGFDSFFASTEEAKHFLKNKKSNIVRRKEPSPKAILATALEGKKPNKLLGGEAAALLSYSVLNDFSTSRAPDQLEYKAAVLSEFPSLTEEEKRSSLGSSLLQVKSLIENMTDVLMKSRNGMQPFPAGKPGTWDDASDSSASSIDCGDSDDDDSLEGSKRQKASAESGAPMNHLHQHPSKGYQEPFPVQGVPPSQYPPHAAPPFYGGAHPHPPFGAPAAYNRPIHYPQDPRMHPYQQAYPGVPQMQPNYYPNAPGYRSHKDGTNQELSRHRSLSIDMTEEDITKGGAGDDFEEFLDRLSEHTSPRRSARKRPRQSEERHHHQGQYYQQHFKTPLVSKAQSKKYGDVQLSGSGIRSLTVSPVNSTPTPTNQSQSLADVDDQHTDGNNGQFWESSTTFGEASYNNQERPHSPVGLNYHQRYRTGRSRSPPAEGATPSYFFGE